MIVAITGGSGFLGAHLVRALLARGARVRVLAREGGDRANLAGLPLEIVDGTLDGPLPDGFLHGADALLHAAAVFQDAAHPERLRAVNVEGTRRVLDFAARAGIRRVVHVSTMGTCTPAHEHRASTEADTVPLDRASRYVLTKLEGERLALARTDLEVVVVNPGAPIGPFDRKPTVTGARILQVLRGRRPELPPGPVNYLPASACAEGILRALDRGRAGERYLLGGEHVGAEDFVRRVAALAGIATPRPRLGKRLRGLLGLRPAGPPHLMIDDAKARRELGHTAGDLDHAIRDAIDDFRARGAVRPVSSGRD